MSDDNEYSDNVLDFPRPNRLDGDQSWQLSDIILIGGSYEFNEENIAEGDEDIETEIPFRADIEKVEADVVRLIHDFDLQLRMEESSRLIMRITARYRVYYQTKEQLDQDAINELQEPHRMMDTWPYFRGYVQSLVGRSGMPPVPMPW